ncbi:MAG: helix-turn-helix transcriptional regulator [Clostridia bacterium]|nr:helix-turn-helix transcriptional regulator [Clostridia bacterium]
MTIEEQIRIVCVFCHVSLAELARRLGQSPQSLNGKLKRQSFTIKDLEEIAEALGCTFERTFILPDGRRV